MRRARLAMGWFAGCGRRGSRWRSARRATSSVARAIGPRTDKRDAIRLARLFAAGDLRLVWGPSEEQEQLRDLVRCREDLRADLMRARHRLATFLLRRERYFPRPGARWAPKHRPSPSQQPPLALPTALRRSPVTDPLRRLPARPRRAARPPRPRRARARAARPGL